MLRRMKKRFLDWPLAKKFVVVFSVMTLLSGALMVGALHLGLSVFEEKFYEKSLQELDFFLQRVDGDIQEVDTLTRSIAVDSAVQQQLGELAAADPETAAYYYLLTGCARCCWKSSTRAASSAASSTPTCTATP